jgi:hypothetical protein
LGALTLLRGDTMLLCGPDMAERLPIEAMLEMLYASGDVQATALALSRAAGGASVLLMRCEEKR